MLGEHMSKIAKERKDKVTLKRDQWTKDKIIEELTKMLDDTGMKRMPTSAEVSSYFGNYKLSNAISKRKLWLPLAKELGLDTKESETTFGKTYEAKAMEHLICLGYEVEKMPQNFPYDLLIEKSIKIDVKASNLYKGEYGNFYTFNLDKPFATCDIYILYIIGSQHEVKDILVIPSKFVIENTQISVGEKRSKYYKYSNKWVYIQQYLEFTETVV